MGHKANQERGIESPNSWMCTVSWSIIVRNTFWSVEVPRKRNAKTEKARLYK